jgi:hypothetical protein
MEWSKLSRVEKPASVLYPRQVSKERQAEMERLARNEGKKSPLQAEPRIIQRRGFDPGLVAAWNARAKRLRGEE